MTSKTITHIMVKVDVLEAWRKRVKVKKSDLARGLGICPRTLSRYLSRARFPWAHFKLLQAIIKETGDDPDGIIDQAIYSEQTTTGQRAIEVTR